MVSCLLFINVGQLLRKNSNAKSSLEFQQLKKWICNFIIILKDFRFNLFKIYHLKKYKNNY